MTNPQTHASHQPKADHTPPQPPVEPTPPEAILCPHCQRTATNGIKCQGICVADSSY